MFAAPRGKVHFMAHRFHSQANGTGQSVYESQSRSASFESFACTRLMSLFTDLPRRSSGTHLYIFADVQHSMIDVFACLYVICNAQSSLTMVQGLKWKGCNASDASSVPHCTQGEESHNFSGRRSTRRKKTKDFTRF